jgi:hypothetical protein
MPESRSELRRTRYKQLRALGYSVAEARKLRDNKADKIDQNIASKQRRIARKPVAKRTVEETFQYERIREYRKQRREQPTVSREPIESANDRYENFSKWSSKRNGFPRRIQRYIADLNIAAGHDPLDSYGYRVFFHQYVNGTTERKAKTQVRNMGDNPSEKWSGK